MTMNSTAHGFELGTGDAPLISTRDPREEAKARSVVRELLERGLIEDRFHKGQVFPVTELGHNLAGELGTPEKEEGAASSSLDQLLRRLPLRAIVAVAGRAARRVQSLIHFPDDETKRQQHQHAVEDALEAAEAFCLGRVLADVWSPGDEVGRPRVVADANAAYSAAKSDAAARAVSSAFQTVMSAWVASRRNVNDVVERAVSAIGFAFTAAESAASTPAEKRAAESVVVSAVNKDIQKFLGFDCGRFPQLGRPVDASERGPLGALSPG